MTSVEFTTLAHQIAGRFWKSRLGPMIGRERAQVYRYATGTPIPLSVRIAMRALAKPVALEKARSLADG